MTLGSPHFEGGLIGYGATPMKPRTAVAIVAGRAQGDRTPVQTHGFHPECFASAEPFLARDNRHEPACLVLDIQMDGMSGIEVRYYLKASGSELPIIYHFR